MWHIGSPWVKRFGVERAHLVVGAWVPHVEIREKPRIRVSRHAKRQLVRVGGRVEYWIDDVIVRHVYRVSIALKFVIAGEEDCGRIHNDSRLISKKGSLCAINRIVVLMVNPRVLC